MYSSSSWCVRVQLVHACNVNTCMQICLHTYIHICTYMHMYINIYLYISFPLSSFLSSPSPLGRDSESPQHRKTANLGQFVNANIDFFQMIAPLSPSPSLYLLPSFSFLSPLLFPLFSFSFSFSSLPLSFFLCSRSPSGHDSESSQHRKTGLQRDRTGRHAPAHPGASSPRH